MNGLLWGREREATLSPWAHSEQYFYCSPPNRSSRKYFGCQNAAGWLTFSYKTCSAERGENFSQKEVGGGCLFSGHRNDTGYLCQFVDNIL